MSIEKIHTEFYDLLHQFISSRIKIKEDAKDVLQEVFIKIASKLDSLADNSKLKSWIYTITRNTIIDYFRKNSAALKTEGANNIAENIMAETDEDMTKGLDKCLKGFIHELPAEYRDIIIDSEIKGIRQKDLAVKYNLPYSSLRSRVQRGRMRLKEMLLTCCNIKADSRGNILERTSNSSCNNSCGDGCA